MRADAGRLLRGRWLRRLGRLFRRGRGGAAASVSVPAAGAVGAAATGAADAVFAKRTMAFSPARTVTLSVSVAPSGPLNFTVCAPGSTKMGSVSGVVPALSPSTVTSVPDAAATSMRPSLACD